MQPVNGGDGTVVDHLTHKHKIEGSKPATDTIENLAQVLSYRLKFVDAEIKLFSGQKMFLNIAPGFVAVDETTDTIK